MMIKLFLILKTFVYNFSLSSSQTRSEAEPDLGRRFIERNLLKCLFNLLDPKSALSYATLVWDDERVQYYFLYRKQLLNRITNTPTIRCLTLLAMAATITASEQKNYDSCVQQKPSDIITTLIVARILNKKPFEIEAKKTKTRNIFSCCTAKDHPKATLIIHFYKHPLPEYFDNYDKTSFNDYYDDEFAEPKIIDGFLDENQITQILTAIVHNNKKPKILLQQSSHDELCSIQSSFSNDLSQTLSSSSSSHKIQDLSSLHDSFCALLPQEANSLAVSQEQISDILTGEYPTSLFFGPLVGKSFIPPHRRYRYVHPENFRGARPEWPQDEKDEAKQWKEKEKFRCK